VGVFKAREGLALYFSPTATRAMEGRRLYLSSVPGEAMSLVACPCPEEMSVEVVVGAWDEPSWYDRPEDEIAEELEIRVLDVMGYLGPDKDLEVARSEFAAKNPKAA
jgi:hypothetical protein